VVIPPPSHTLMEAPLPVTKAIAANLPVEQVPVALTKLTTLSAALAARLPGGGGGKSELPAAPEFKLSIDDMMRMTGKSRRWLFEHKHLPFIRVISRKTLV